jgi:hypothetical protein
MQCWMPVRYPLSSLLIALMLATIAAIFVFARPEYHEPRFPGERTIDLSAFPAAASGWTWAGGQPGYRFGQREEDWNMSQLKPRELEPLRAVAQRLGMHDVRPLAVERYAPHRLAMIVAATNGASRTCLGFALPERPISFACPHDAAAFVAIVPNPSGAFVFGIVRGEVRSVTVQQPGEPSFGELLGPGAWGTFAVTLAGRQAQLNVGGRQTRLMLAGSPRLLRVAG